MLVALKKLLPCFRSLLTMTVLDDFQKSEQFFRMLDLPAEE